MRLRQLASPAGQLEQQEVVRVVRVDVEQSERLLDPVRHGVAVEIQGRRRLGQRTLVVEVGVEGMDQPLAPLTPQACQWLEHGGNSLLSDV
jgi:hypothetical protein